MEQWQRCSYNHCVQIKDRSCFTFAIKKSGNRFGQLGRKSQKKNDDKSPQQVVLPVDVEIQDVADVAAGGSKDSGHTLVVTGQGQVYAFGCDRWQQLGLGGNTTNAGYTWKKGKIWHHQPQLISALTDVVAVAAGDDHSVALTRKGEVWTAWSARKTFSMSPDKKFRIVKHISRRRQDNRKSKINKSVWQLYRNIFFTYLIKTCWKMSH